MRKNLLLIYIFNLNYIFIIGLCFGFVLSIFLVPSLDSNCLDFHSKFNDGIHSGSIRDLRSSNSEGSDDYEPQIKLLGNLEVNKNELESRKLMRPRYYSTELGIKEKLLVSIMSTNNSIKKFGVSLNKTLNHYVNKLIFFVDGTGSRKLGLNIPVVGFKERRPLIEIFRAISYLSENYMDYDYYLFITDQSYVNGKKFMTMLENISVSLDVHMGVPLDPDSVYCNLNSGVVLSQSVLRMVIQNLNWCVKQAFSDSASENFGLCILHSSNVRCRSSYQNQSFVGHSMREKEVHGDTSKNPFLGSVSVTDLVSPEDVFTLHTLFLKEHIIETQSQISKLRNDIERTVNKLNSGEFSAWPFGSPQPHRPSNRFDSINWESFNATHLFPLTEFQNIKLIEGVDRLDLKNVVESSVSHLEKKSNQTIKFHSMNFGHRRYDPTRGMDYVLSLSFRHKNGRKVDKIVECHRSVTQGQVVPMPYVTENVRLHVLVFVSPEDASEATSFINRFDTKRSLERVNLVFYLLYKRNESSENDPFKEFKNRMTSFSRTFNSNDNRASFVQWTVGGGASFNLGVVDIALKKLSSEALVFVTDVRGTLDVEGVARVRMNAIKNWQVFCPIPFVMFRPEFAQNATVYRQRKATRANGHFDRFSFENVAFYVDDYVKARRRVLKQIPLVRTPSQLLNTSKFPQTTVCDLFAFQSSLHVLRGVEPTLVMSYSAVHCPSSQDSLTDSDCYLRRIHSEGERSTLSLRLYSDKNL